MSSWTLGKFLLALLGATFIPAIIIHFTLGRNGGHHLFKGERKPFEFARRYHKKKMLGSLYALIGLFFAVALYPLACILGYPMSHFSLNHGQLNTWIIAGAALSAAVLVGIINGKS